jgi:hypothetical protein
MAVSLALYALGVSLESRPDAGASPLIPISIALGVLATLIFLGDLIYLARQEFQRRRALEQPSPEFGELDYGPEFQNAVRRYVQAESQITDATDHTSEVFQRSQPLDSQQKADECGTAAQQLCQEFERRLPEMRESGEISRTCLRGVLKASQVATKADADELLTLRERTRGARRGTAQYLHAMKGARKTAKQLRDSNRSRSLNEASVQLQARLDEAIKVARATVRGFAAAERQMTRRLLWYSVRARLTPSTASGASKDLSS